MSSNFYPALPTQLLKQVMDLYENNPEYFSDPECPYDQRIKDLFTCTNPVNDFDSHAHVSKPMGETDLQQEIADLYEGLKTYGETAKTSDNASDRNTYFRLSVGLLEKIVELKERLIYIQNVNTFIETVLDAMGDILNPDQRNEFTARVSKLTADFVPAKKTIQ